MLMEFAFVGWGLLCFIMGVVITNLAIVQQDEPESDEDIDNFEFWIDD